MGVRLPTQEIARTGVRIHSPKGFISKV
jgi:hypothetical protein